MFFEVRQLRESPVVANEAFKWFFTGVTPDVHFQSGGVRKSSVADGATIRSDARVRPLVDCQLRPLNEPHIAPGTLVGLFGAVDPHMLQQVPLVPLVADFALEGLQVGVEPGQVLLKAVTTDEGFSAFVADIVPGSLVPFDVVKQVVTADEVAIAFWAHKRTSFCVRPQVLSQLTPPRKSLRTVGAAEKHKNP